MTGPFHTACAYPPCERESIGSYCWEHGNNDLLRWLTEDTESVRTVAQNQT